MVLVDLIAAVGIGVFIANILTVKRMKLLQSTPAETITDADDIISLEPGEKHWLDVAKGLLCSLTGRINDADNCTVGALTSSAQLS